MLDSYFVSSFLSFLFFVLIQFLTYFGFIILVALKDIWTLSPIYVITFDTQFVKLLWVPFVLIKSIICFSTCYSIYLLNSLEDNFVFEKQRLTFIKSIDYFIFTSYQFSWHISCSIMLTIFQFAILRSNSIVIIFWPKNLIKNLFKTILKFIQVQSASIQ